MDVYERALLAVGERGKFQLRYGALYNVVLVVCATIVYLNIVMVMTVPPHSCRLPVPPPNITLSEWKQRNIPLEQDAKGIEVLSSCRINIDGTNDTAECAAYEYERTWYGSTAATTHDWVCSQELLVADVFAYSRLGEAVGSLVLGWLGDTYGRKLAYITSLALMVSGRLLTAFSSQSFALFLCGCIITAFPSTNALQSVMVISMESTTAEHRAQAMMVQTLAWATGVTLMPLLYWWLREWLLFLLVTTCTLVPFLLLSWHHSESPLWLWTSGRSKDCIKRLRYIARVNGRRLPQDIEKELLAAPPPASPPTAEVTSLGPLSMFSSCTLAINTLCVLTLWFCGMACYFIVIMSGGEGDEGGNPFLQLAGQGLAEVPGYLVGAWAADHVGRRVTACSALAVSSVLSLCTAFGWPHNWLLGTLMLLARKLCLTANYYVLALITTEIYPTCMRQTALSIGNVISSGSFAVAPYITYLGRRLDARLPGLIVAGMCVIGLLAASLLPETLHAALPETLLDAQEFGRNRLRDYFKLPQKKVPLKTDQCEDESLILKTQHASQM